MLRTDPADVAYVGQQYRPVPYLAMSSAATQATLKHISPASKPAESLLAYTRRSACASPVPYGMGNISVSGDNTLFMLYHSQAHQDKTKQLRKLCWKQDWPTHSAKLLAEALPRHAECAAAIVDHFQDEALWALRAACWVRQQKVLWLDVPANITEPQQRHNYGHTKATTGEEG